MRKYQDADYRTIHVSEPFDVAPLGKCWLVLFCEDGREQGSDVPDNIRWWSALFLVCPAWAGADKVRDSLDFIGFPRPPQPVDEAVALAEAGHRYILYERQSDDWEADEAAALEEARRWLADPGRLEDLLAARPAVLEDLR